MIQWPTIPRDGVPELSATRMREVDRIMIEELGVDLLQMMELAGSHLAALALGLFGPALRTGPVLVLAGGGNNGGGGLSAARHLVNRGATVVVLTVGDPEAVKPAPRHQRRILDAMGVPVRTFESPDPGTIEQVFSEAALLLDCVVGYGLAGSLTGAPRRAVETMNRSGRPVLSLDVPSGFDTMGESRTPCVRAQATLALALPKAGLLSEAGRERSGRIFLGDIGVPPELYRRVGEDPGCLFSRGRLLEIASGC